jgi:hypothetical protein
MRTEAASNPACDHFGFSCRQGILPDLSNSDCLPGRAGGTPVGLAFVSSPLSFLVPSVARCRSTWCPFWRSLWCSSGSRSECGPSTRVTYED